jgi:hypothetical protein
VAVEIQDLATFGHAARIVAAYIDLNPVRAGMVVDPATAKTPGTMTKSACQFPATG